VFKKRILIRPTIAGISGENGNNLATFLRARGDGGDRSIGAIVRS